MSGIMLGNSPAKLYLGDILLTGGGGYTDEDIVEMSWKILKENYTPTFAFLSKAETPYASYWRCWSDVAWNMKLVPYDYTENFTKVYAKMRASTLYANQGSYSGSTLTPPILIPDSTSNSKWLQMGEHLTVPCKFEVKNLTNLTVCHPAISDRYTFTDAGWYDYHDEYNIYELFDVGLTAQDNIVIVRFASGDYIYRYPSGSIPTAHIENGTVFRFDAVANVDYVKISGVIGTAYTDIPTFSYTSSSGTYSVDPATEALLVTTCDIYDSTNGNLLFAKNADITDYIVT